LNTPDKQKFKLDLVDYEKSDLFSQLLALVYCFWSIASGLLLLTTALIFASDFRI